MDKYIERLCKLGVPACYASALVADFWKNFTIDELEEFVSSLEQDDIEKVGVPCVF